MGCLSYSEFKTKYNRKIRVLCNFPRSSILVNSVKICRNKLELEDFKHLESLQLVWYKNPYGKSARWDSPGARSITCGNMNDVKAYPPGARRNIAKLVMGLKKRGLTKDIEIVSVTDSTFGETLIVDGNHRAVALCRLIQNSPDVVWKLLSSQKFGIYLVNFNSPRASKFFKADFSALGY